MKVAILGAGAVGGYYGGRLAQAGHNVRFLYHSELEAVRANGLRIESVDGSWQGPVQAFGKAEEIGPCDAVVVAFKSAQAELFPRILPAVLAPDGFVVCLMNGLGHEEMLARVVGHSRVVAGAAFICAERGEPGVVHHYAVGGLSMGPYFEEGRDAAMDFCQKMSGLFEGAEVPCKALSDGPGIKWGKLVWNVPFSGLSVWAGGITTDRIVSDPSLRAFAQDLMQEVLLAAGACGVELDPRAPGRNLKQTEGMGAYRPSMLVDFLAGRPIEWEAIVAEPLRRGEAAGASLPRMRELLEGIRARL
ncbi:MAG: 2-dehydropantoate 2-reductase [Fibrobacterota bacterium]|nr:2-dehydropantoate 2-reductase [Fibrobacterota bacterium]QQS04698.1 MAG: 2-dehydropantoate 2-reductase [Fibrobacterota bacterium]